MAYRINRDVFKWSDDEMQNEWSGWLYSGARSFTEYNDQVLLPLILGQPMSEAQLDNFIRRAYVNKVHESNSTPPHDVIHLGAMQYAFSTRAFNIIDGVAPGRYPFFELDMIAVDAPFDGLEDNAVNPKPIGKYCLLHLTTFIDCIDYDQTNFVQGNGADAAASSGYRTPNDELIAVKPDTIVGHHLWRATEPAQMQMFVSDQIHDAFKDAGLTGWSFEPCKTALSAATAE